MSQTQFLESIEVQLSFVQMIPSSAQQCLDAIAIALAAYKLSQGASETNELDS
jgi:hypothetical protein